MGNPTDQITYAQAVTDLAPRQATFPTAYGTGVLDGYRLMAEGTPLAVILAGNSAPTQTPQPNLAYVDWEQTSLQILLVRQFHKQGTGYGDGLIDTWRRFGGDHWPTEYLLEDIAGLPHPNPPPNPPLFNSGRPAPVQQPAIAPPWDPSSPGGIVHTTPPPEWQPTTSPYFMLGDFNGVTIPGHYSFNGPGSDCTMTDGPYKGLVIPWKVGANSTPPTMLMTPMLPLYPAAVQTAAFTEHALRGYKDFIVAAQVWNDAANGYTSTPATAAANCAAAKAWGFRPVLWNGSTQPPNGDPYFRACLSDGVVAFYVCGKEVGTGGYSSQQYAAVVQTAITDCQGAIPIAAHLLNYPDGFPQDTFFAGGSTGPSWADLDGALHLCYEANNADDAGTQGARLYYARERVTVGGVGGDGRPAPNCRVYTFETMATSQLEGQCDELTGKRRSLELNYCPQGGATGMIHGSGNGISDADGTQIPT